MVTISVREKNKENKETDNTKSESDRKEQEKDDGNQEEDQEKVEEEEKRKDFIEELRINIAETAISTVSSVVSYINPFKDTEKSPNDSTEKTNLILLQFNDDKEFYETDDKTNGTMEKRNAKKERKENDSKENDSKEEEEEEEEACSNFTRRRSRRNKRTFHIYDREQKNENNETNRNVSKDSIQVNVKRRKQIKQVRDYKNGEETIRRKIENTERKKGTEQIKKVNTCNASNSIDNITKCEESFLKSFESFIYQVEIRNQPHINKLENFHMGPYIWSIAKKLINKKNNMLSRADNYINTKKIESCFKKNFRVYIHNTSDAYNNEKHIFKNENWFEIKKLEMNKTKKHEELIDELYDVFNKFVNVPGFTNNNNSYHETTKTRRNSRELKNKNELKKSIFVAVNKKERTVIKQVKEGDYIFIKFSKSKKKGYDIIRVLRDKVIFYLLLYLIQNNANIEMQNLSAHCPELLWNLILHNDNVSNLDNKLTEIMELKNRLLKVKEGNNILDLPKEESKKKKVLARTQYEKENRNSEIKFTVELMNKFLEGFNKSKREKLLQIRKNENRSSPIDRKTINFLDEEQLLALVIDKRTGINKFPLMNFYEKTRNIIYENNLKMNMFACIKIKYDERKGRCVIAEVDMYKYDFIFEYVGILLTDKEAKKREKIYEQDPQIGCYMYYFKCDNKKYCIDSTNENIDVTKFGKDKKQFLRSFARLVNHSKKNANLKAKVLKINNVPRLFFIASKDIKQGEELLFDYGERDREIIKNNPWLKE